MKFLTIADWTGMIETELFARTYKSYGLATVRYPVLEITAKVEPFENGRGHDNIIGTNGDGISGSDEANFFGPVQYDVYLEFWRTAVNGSGTAWSTARPTCCAHCCGARWKQL